MPPYTPEVLFSPILSRIPKPQRFLQEIIGPGQIGGVRGEKPSLVEMALVDHSACGSCVCFFHDVLPDFRCSPAGIGGVGEILQPEQVSFPLLVAIECVERIEQRKLHVARISLRYCSEHLNPCQGVGSRASNLKSLEAVPQLEMGKLVTKDGTKLGFAADP